MTLLTTESFQEVNTNNLAHYMFVGSYITREGNIKSVVCHLQRGLNAKWQEARSVLHK